MTSPGLPSRSTLAVVAGGMGGAALGVLGLIWWLQPAPALERPSELPTTPASLSAAQHVEQPERADATAAPTGMPSSRPRTPRLASLRRTPLVELTQTHEWPSEPDAPHDVDDARFAAALEVLCGPYADDAVKPWYAPWILRAAREFASDPFLLGGLLFSMSGCSAAERGPGANPTGLDAALYAPDLQRRRYRYRVFEGGSWRERERELRRFPFSDEFVHSPESNLYFAAAFLQTWQEQASGLRAAFVQPSEYRHSVSHFVWGDQVQSHREEDAILSARRRLLEYYGTLSRGHAVRWRGFELGCPLDGCPRVVTSTLGDARDQGARLHAGNDFESTRGEPVRAVADGLVVFAGVDLPGKGAASRIPIWAQRNVQPEIMGAGGLYVCIDHGQSRQGEKLVSCYMHLEAATVVQGRSLRRGDQVGRVGTSGIKQSRPHLHFELHASDGVHRAIDVLRGLALGHPTAHEANQGARPAHAFSADDGAPSSP